MNAAKMSAGRRSINRLSAALVVVAAAASFVTPSAVANAPIHEFTVSTTTTQAGGHPDVTTLIVVGNRQTQNVPPPNCVCQDAKTLSINYPPGLVGTPQLLPQCTEADFGNDRCPIDSQVGITNVGFGSRLPNDGDGSAGQADGFAAVPVYNLVPHPGQAGLLGFTISGAFTPIYIVFEPRTEGDYGLNASIDNITHALAISYTEFTLWGVPASSDHDERRIGPRGCNAEATGGAPACELGFSSNAPLAPFVDNPSNCGPSPIATLDVLAYDLGTDSASTPFPETTGCDLLSFNPSQFAQPTTSEADSPSGVAIELRVPQGESPSSPASSALKGVTLTLPKGFSINANAADGKTTCSSAQANLGNRDAPAECPEFSKVGALGIHSSSLPGVLPGYVYLGDPLPGDRYRLWLIAEGFGIHSKISGTVQADRETGQLTTIFEKLPQFPFEVFDIHLFGSERGLLATPTRCGTYSVDSVFTPWDEALPIQRSSQFFTIDSGPGGTECPSSTRPFAPSFTAGVADKTAGAHSTFSLELDRPDGDQNLSGLTVHTPPGVSATLKGIPYCPQSAIEELALSSYSGIFEQQTPACPVASQIGTVVAGAGAGSRPYYAGGKAYLAGPYKGAPLSLVVVIPAVEGPYDLGNVAVRAALKVDPETAQVTAVSDPLPQILEGIPLRTRKVAISLDRPDFILNPTNCDPFEVASRIDGDEGAQSDRSNRFQVADCAELPYAPKLSMNLTGGLNRLGHPAIHSILQVGPGEANSRTISVALPKGEQLDNSHLGTVCTRVDFANDTCPDGSLVGSVEVTTPVLDQPLTGKAYLRSSKDGLPDLALALKGQVDLDAVAKIDSVRQGLRATFKTVPDVPFSTIKLDLLGGKKGLLQNSESLCGAHKRATVKMVGQNGARISTKIKLRADCGSDGQRKRPHRHVHRAREAS